jgi:signal transduction histidine kinase
MTHRNTTQKDDLIEPNSYTFAPIISDSQETMKAAPAKVQETSNLEDVGRATLQIVHDLKNQLNGLKLYATFLRKRFERDDRATEERETLAKLIAGLDRSAREMTALVNYSRPVEIQRQPHTDLRRIIRGAARVALSRTTGDLERADVTYQIEEGEFFGEFDSPALAEAFNAMTEHALSNVPQRDINLLSLHVSRIKGGSPKALVEWRGVQPANPNSSATSFNGHATVHMALAAKTIEAHGGQIEYAASAIRAWLPLSE